MHPLQGRITGIPVPLHRVREARPCALGFIPFGEEIATYLDPQSIFQLLSFGPGVAWVIFRGMADGGLRAAGQHDQRQEQQNSHTMSPLRPKQRFRPIAVKRLHPLELNEGRSGNQL